MRIGYIAQKYGFYEAKFDISNEITFLKPKQEPQGPPLSKFYQSRGLQKHSRSWLLQNLIPPVTLQGPYCQHPKDLLTLHWKTHQGEVISNSQEINSIHNHGIRSKMFIKLVISSIYIFYGCFQIVIVKRDQIFWGIF